MNSYCDFVKIILLALVLLVLWDACLYYETPPSLPYTGILYEVYLANDICLVGILKMR